VVLGLENTGKWSDGAQWLNETAGASEVSAEVKTYREGVFSRNFNGRSAVRGQYASLYQI